MDLEVAARGHRSDNGERMGVWDLQTRKTIPADDGMLSFIHDAKHDNDVLPLRLGYKFCDDSNVFQRALSICISHDTIHEVDLTALARVVIASEQNEKMTLFTDENQHTILRSRYRVKIEIDTQTVFSRPLKGFQSISTPRAQKKKNHQSE